MIMYGQGLDERSEPIKARMLMVKTRSILTNKAIILFTNMMLDSSEPLEKIDDNLLLSHIDYQQKLCNFIGFPLCKIKKILTVPGHLRIYR